MATWAQARTRRDTPRNALGRLQSARCARTPPRILGMAAADALARDTAGTGDTVHEFWYSLLY
jgi:hypothetical protein